MSSSDGYSDIHPDRIHARERSYLQDVQARSPLPVARRRIDPTELYSMGAHLDLSFKQQSWPKSIGDLTDDEGASQTLGPIPEPLETILHSQPHRNDNSADESPTTRTCTPTACGPYLTPSEMDELWRRRSVKLANRTGPSSEPPPAAEHSASIATTVDPGFHDEQDPESRNRTYTMLSESHTPSHRSMSTADGDNYPKKDRPGSPIPCLKWNEILGKCVARGKG